MILAGLIAESLCFLALYVLPSTSYKCACRRNTECQIKAWQRTCSPITCRHWREKSWSFKSKYWDCSMNTTLSHSKKKFYLKKKNTWYIKQSSSGGGGMLCLFANIMQYCTCHYNMAHFFREVPYFRVQNVESVLQLAGRSLYHTSFDMSCEGMWKNLIYKKKTANKCTKGIRYLVTLLQVTFI